MAGQSLRQIRIAVFKCLGVFLALDGFGIVKDIVAYQGNLEEYGGYLQ
jgi:hypothetical protein